MITLNSEKGLIQVEDWADIVTQPGFIRDLDPTAHKLKAIIGRYAFSEKIRCGLSNCHTPHAKGYIVVTEDGHETNIGKDCGKTYFGVDFEEMSRRFDQELDDFQNREILATFSFRLDELEARIRSLREGERGADWAYKNIHSLLSIGRGCPDTAVRRLVEMVRARNAEISVERRATDEEVEQLEVQLGRRIPRPHHLSESIGHLRGMEALYPENNLRELLVIDLEAKIDAFRQLSISSLTHAQLKSWAKWIAAVEGTLERASTTVENARVLLTADTLDPLERALPIVDQAKFRSFVRSLRP